MRNAAVSPIRAQNSDVRLNVIAKLDVVQDVVGVDQVTNVLVPEIVTMARDPHVRRNARCRCH